MRDAKPLTGAHTSAAGGPAEALRRGKEIGCATVQLFTKNASQWTARPLSDAEVEAFRAQRLVLGIGPVLAHDSYLINLASSDAAIYRKSLSAFEEEMRRAELLGIDYLVTHPGAHRGTGEAAGIRRVAERLNRLHEKTHGFRLKVLLETTAGQGTALGHRFEHIAEIVDRTDAADRLGVCFDTCHAFAAGYDIRTREGMQETLRAFDRAVGLGRLLAFHMNDSKGGLGSRVDRHEHLGKGAVGLEAFRTIMQDRRFRKVPKVLETPEMETKHRANLRTLNRLGR